MTTQTPPSPEAVEAAMKRAEEDLERDARYSSFLGILPAIERTDRESQLFRDRQTLAAEVERLREQNKRQAIDLCAYVAEVAELRVRADAVCLHTQIGDKSNGNSILSAECDGRFVCMNDDEPANYCPACGRKVKIQTNTSTSTQ